MKKILLIIAGTILLNAGIAQPKKYDLIGYYTGDAATLKQYPVEQLTHLIFSFAHLKGNELFFYNEKRKEQLKEIVQLKSQYPNLKVMIAMGGWGGCKTCSPVFSSAENRQAFAASAVRILQETGADGLDLDWEYPTVPGPPGHPYSPEDKDNFTDLLAKLRAAFGTKYELSFAAGGYDEYLDKAVDWDAVTPLVDRINLMTYDLVNGYSTVTGHHTPLYSRSQLKQSTDNCVQNLLQKKVPPEKLVIGAAFYSRMWEGVSAQNNGLLQPGKQVTGYGYNAFHQKLSEAQGFKPYWDDTAQAMHFYNAAEQKFATMDDPKSIAAKVEYMKQHQLGGIMFWELMNDSFKNGLLTEMFKAVHQQ